MNFKGYDIKIEDINNKKSVNDFFENEGCGYFYDNNKNIFVIYNDLKYTYEYKTNVIFTIPDNDIKFMLCSRNGISHHLYLNQNWHPSAGFASVPRMPINSPVAKWFAQKTGKCTCYMDCNKDEKYLTNDKKGIQIYIE